MSKLVASTRVQVEGVSVYIGICHWRTKSLKIVLCQFVCPTMCQQHKDWNLALWSEGTLTLVWDHLEWYYDSLTDLSTFVLNEQLTLNAHPNPRPRWEVQTDRISPPGLVTLCLVSYDWATMRVTFWTSYDTSICSSASCHELMRWIQLDFPQSLLPRLRMPLSQIWEGSI